MQKRKPEIDSGSIGNCENTNAVAIAKRARISAPSTMTHSNDSTALQRCSNEAMLLIFSYLSSPDLAICSRVSRKFHSFANDEIVWKGLFYDTFIRPRTMRAQRILSCAGLRKLRIEWFNRTANTIPHQVLSSAPSLSTTMSGGEWKALFKLHHNWHKGRCSIGAFDVSHLASHAASKAATVHTKATPEDLVVRFSGKLIFTADAEHGLCAWTNDGHLVSSTPVPKEYCDDKAIDGERKSRFPYGPPSALYVHASNNEQRAKETEKNSGELLTVVVGFVHGGFAMYSMSTQGTDFKLLHIQRPRAYCEHQDLDPITSIVSEHPFVVTLSRLNRVEIYKFDADAAEIASLIYTIRSHNITGPTTLSLRRARSTNVVYATIAYTHTCISSGWTVAVQEIKLDDTSDNIVSLRAASSLPSSSSPASKRKTRFDYNHILWPSFSMPTSLSYAHPFLLTSHADNTLAVYHVRSTASELSIGPGCRLWGHTSAVANVEVQDRGRAVSISQSGREMRVWDLEAAAIEDVNKTQHAMESVRVVIDNYKDIDDEGRVGKFLGFDEEKVVVEQQRQRSRMVMVYDFT
ncbi:uncharacterized protein V1518DRAFT_422269 [Limtongia smithiae]|uniref:uncharacterized protein n=1 Tax=Limtongia smithiae TaxID=1125753 RepID=UPI0034CE6D47